MPFELTFGVLFDPLVEADLIGEENNQCKRSDAHKVLPPAHLPKKVTRRRLYLYVPGSGRGRKAGGGGTLG